MIDRFTPIHDPKDARILPYRDQKDAWLRAGHNPDSNPDDRYPGACETGLFISEGALVLEHHISSPYPLHSVLIDENKVQNTRDLLDRVPLEVPIYTASRPILDAITGYPIHRGLLACGIRPPQHSDSQIQTLLESSRALVILEDLSNHDNLGSVFRSVAAMCGKGVPILLSPRCCDPLYRKALRVSMGHALTIPYATLQNWPSSLTSVREAGYRILAMTPSHDAVGIDVVAQNLPFSSKIAVMLGAEGPGLTGAAMDASDEKVRIPLVDSADSLNIAVAAAVAFHRLIPPAQEG